MRCGSLLVACVLVAWVGAACVSVERDGLPLQPPPDATPITDVTMDVRLAGPDSAVDGQQPRLEWRVRASARQGTVTLVPRLGVAAEALGPSGGVAIRFPVFYVQEPGASEVSGTLDSPVPVVAGETLRIRLIATAAFTGDDQQTAGIERSATLSIPGVPASPTAAFR